MKYSNRMLLINNYCSEMQVLKLQWGRTLNYFHIRLLKGKTNVGKCFDR